MNQYLTDICTTCGTPLNSRLGLEACPRCLLASGLKPDDEVTVESTAPDAAVADSQPVPLVSGRYTNKKSHAPGGMGHVFIAHDRSLNRTIAIKELRAKVGPVGRTSLPDSRAVRFLREAQITAKLEHPAVTPVHELGVRDDGTLYYTMKLVEGATLSESIFKGQTREERLQYLPNLVSVANAAAYAHSKGVIHRDIKPDNIVLGDYGETVLVDWGVAKIDDEDTLWMDTETYTPADNETDAALTLPGSVIGTPAYMPPEQALGKNRELDERADVYSLGAVIYSILTIERGEIEDEFRILPDNFGNLGAGVIANRDVILTPHADRLIFGDSSSRWREFSFSDETLSTPVSSNANGKQWMSMSQDGRYLVTATLSDVRVLNSDAEETSSFRRYRRGDDSFKLPFHQNYRLSFDAIFSEDAKYLFAPDDKGNLSILSLPEYQEVARWSDHKVPLHPWQNTTV